MIPRPVSYMNEFLKSYPSLASDVMQMIDIKHSGAKNWPDWCFLPVAGWYAIVSKRYRHELDERGHLPMHLISNVSILAAFGTWRYSQGIYRFDKALFDALIDTGISGEIPSQALFNLPEWCVYIDTPGFSWLGQKAVGFFACLEHDANDSSAELRLLIDAEQGMINVPLHIGAWTVEQGVKKMLDKAEHGHDAAVKLFNMGDKETLVNTLSTDISKALSLLLYLCSDEPEISDKKQGKSYPKNPEWLRTKKGFKLFPANHYREWSVGRELGERLARDKTASKSGYKVTPHLRRAHWHGFWTGPMNSERVFNYKWLPPIFVGDLDGKE